MRVRGGGATVLRGTRVDSAALRPDPTKPGFIGDPGQWPV